MQKMIFNKRLKKETWKLKILERIRRCVSVAKKNNIADYSHYLCELTIHDIFILKILYFHQKKNVQHEEILSTL